MRVKTSAAVALLGGILLSGQALAQLDSTEQAMIDWIDANADASIELLEQTVNIGSGTMNHDGVREVGRVMRWKSTSLSRINPICKSP